MRKTRQNRLSNLSLDQFLSKAHSTIELRETSDGDETHQEATLAASEKAQGLSERTTETIEKLRLRNIGFRSLTESIDTTTAQGVLIFHMFRALAEFERALIRERTRAGLKSATQEFNSLVNQREAAEAYVKSQAHGG